MEDCDRDYDKTAEDITVETAPTQVVSPGCPDPSALGYLDHSALDASTEVSTLHRQQIAEDLTADSLQTSHLQTQVRWLKAGLVTSVLVLGGTLGGILFGLNQERMALRDAQGELSAQVETLEEAVSAEASADVPAEAPFAEVSGDLSIPALPSLEQLNQIESQLTALTQQMQLLSERIQGISQQLPDLSPQLWTDLQSQLAALEQALQNGFPSEALNSQLAQLSERLSALFNQSQPDQTDAADTTP